MDSPTLSAPRLGREARIAIVWLTAAALAAAAFLAPPYAQPEAYHRFADDRTLLGIPNMLDVVSNFAFVIVGAMGLAFVLRGRRADGGPAFTDASEKWAWGVAFVAVALTCCGSAYYHLAPDSPRLAWDRLPMAVGFMCMVAAIAGERISTKAGPRLIVPLALLGAASVWYFVPPAAFIGALRLAKPSSPWARWRYGASPAKIDRARRRDEGFHQKWERRKHRLWDVIGGKPHLSLPHRDGRRDRHDRGPRGGGRGGSSRESQV